MSRQTLLAPAWMALALTLTIPAAAMAQANLTGPWEVTIDSPQGAMTIDADLKQEGEALTGVITSPMGTVELKGTFKNDELSFSYTVPLQGQNLDITMTGKLAGDNIDGLVAIAGLGEVPWKAKRKAPGSAPASAPTAAPAASAAPAAVATTGEGISGKWDVLMDTPAGQMPFTATFTQTGDKVAGTIAGPGGDIPIAGTMTGNAVKLDMNVPTPQGELSIVMTGDLGPTGLTGKASTAMGDMTWSATRAK